MKQYKYVAKSADGKDTKGVLEAKNKTDVVEMLQQKGLVVVSVNEDVTMGLARLNEINIGGIPMSDKVVFMRQLSTMITAGLPLSKALEILEAQATNPLFKKVLSSVSDEIQGGTGLADAFRKNDQVFDEITINLLEAGEESGHLDDILVKLAVELESGKKLAEKIKSAFMYPAVVSVVIVIVVAIMMFYLVPAMEQIYSEFDADLPWVTQMLIDISNFMRTFWWLILIVISGIAIGLKYYLETEGGKNNFHHLALKFPVFGLLNKKIQLAQFNRVLGLLLSSGLSIVESLNLTAGSLSNLHFRNAVLETREEVEKGVPMAIPLGRSEYFPLIVSQMIAVGEESGQVDMVLDKMAEYYNDEVEVMTNNLTTLMEPMIMVVVGVIVGFIALAVYMPMFSLIEVMG